MSPDVLKEHNLLLDYDSNYSQILPNSPQQRDPSYLLQVFTEPVFPAERTLFLEVIQRIGSVQGFGENNIRSLWRAVKDSSQHQQNGSQQNDENRTTASLKHAVCFCPLRVELQINRK